MRDETFFNGDNGAGTGGVYGDAERPGSFRNYLSLADCDSDEAASDRCRRYRELVFPSDNRIRFAWGPDLDAADVHDSAFLRDVYDGGLRLADRYVERVFLDLEELGLTENTIVVLTSDPGEAFREHVGPPFGHGYSFFEEYLRVPLVFWLPGENHGRDLDNPVTREFCGDCGTHILSWAPTLPGTVLLKVGTFDDPGLFPGPDMAIFTIDKQTFHQLPYGGATFERTPGG